MAQLTLAEQMPYNQPMRRAIFKSNFVALKRSANCLELFLLLLLTGCGSSVAVWTDGEVPFVRSTPEVIDRMLELAGVKPGDVVYDIGSGDGAIIIYAAKKYGVKGVGIEIDQDLVLRARNNAFVEKVEHLVEFRLQDAFTADVSPATVVTLYMLP